MEWLKSIAKYYAADSIDKRLCRHINSVVSSSQGLLQTRNTAGTGKKVLFFTVQGRPNMLAVMESLLAHSVSLRGASSEMIYCGRQLEFCDLPFVTTSNSGLLCKACDKACDKIFSGFNLPCHSFGRFITETQITEIEAILNDLKFSNYFTYTRYGINIGKHAYSSILRYLLRGTIDNNGSMSAVCRGFMKSALMMVQISKNIIEQLRPDCVVMHHGIYCTTGIFADYVKTKGIDLVVFTPAYRKNTYIFSHDDTYHKTLLEESPDNWQQLEFSEKHENMLDNYLDSRRWGSQDFITYHPNPLENKAKIIQELNLDPARPVTGLFTNLTWDGQVVFHDTAFANMSEWIIETIRYFIQKSSRQLIVRIHPAEVKGAVVTQQRLLPLIRKVFPQLPGHIKVIDSKSDISTYTLSEIINAAIVYTTKVGLEFAIKGIPVIVAGEAFYRNKGFTLDPDTKPQYFSLMDNLETLQTSEEIRRKARKYAHYYFFRRFIPFDLTTNRTWNNVISLKIKHLEELLPGKNKYLDLICSGILTKTPFVISESDI